tara:strand:- start:7 stop:723 length:717 start_codon:yes stop_codon:yes gene_type:complete
MASARDNDIVIECSPYGDSETEIVNLKSPSYEIISPIDFFQFGNSVDTFVSIFLLSGIFLFMIMGAGVIMKLKKTLSYYDLIVKVLNLLYFILFVIGFIVSIPQNQESVLTSEYITFGVVMFLILIIKITELITSKKFNFSKIANTVFPGLTEINTRTNIFYFVFLFGFLYTLIGLFRIINLDAREAFDPRVLLASYCFLQVINHMYKKSSSHSNDTNAEKSKNVTSNLTPNNNINFV